MFWILYMVFSIFRSHRTRFYWRNRKLHFLKQQRPQRQMTSTSLQEERLRVQNIRQWFIFYSIFICIIIGIVIYRFYALRETLN